MPKAAMFFRCTTDSQPSVQWAPGAIQLYDRRLFADPAAEHLQQFVERVFVLDDVQAVEIDHCRQRAKILFSHDKLPADILQQLGAGLRASQCEEGPSQLRELLRSADSRRRKTHIVRCNGAFSMWELRRKSDTHLLLRHEIVARHRQAAKQICQELAKVPGVMSVRIRPFSSSLMLAVQPETIDLVELHRRADELVRRPGGYMSDWAEHDVAFAVSRVQRLINLVLAAGSFIMAVVGVIVPGIPTVPFVILTSYFLVRSSPALNDRLLRSRLFGPMLRDWQKYGGVRREVKWISIGVTLVILVASVILMDISGWLLAVVLVMASFGIYLILRLPTLKVEQEESPTKMRLLPAGAS
jgi:uncharacterized protein